MRRIAVTLLLVAVAALTTGAQRGSKGTWIVFSEMGCCEQRVYAIRSDGTGRRELSVFGNFASIGDGEAELSPNGRRVAFTRWMDVPDAAAQIFVMPAQGGRAMRVTRSPGAAWPDTNPTWSPNGREIAFARERPSPNGEYWAASSIRIAGLSGGTRQVTRGVFYDTDPDWSPDGKTIVFARNTVEGMPDEEPERFRLMLTDPAGRRVRPFPGGIRGREPAWSPDGREVAFVSYPGRARAINNRFTLYHAGEIWVVNADGSGLSRLTSSRLRDSRPTWSPDGKWIVFARQGRLMKIRSSGGRPSEISQTGYDPSFGPD